MTLTAAASGLVVFLLSVQVVQGQNDWGVTYTSTQICALKGSTVDINCTYRYPSKINNVDTAVDKTIWYTKWSNNEPVDLRTDSKYAGRAQYHFDKNNCTLRITDLKERDSADYKFRFTTNQPGGSYTASPGVTLTVTDLQVQVIRPTVYQYSSKAELKCHSTCSLPDRSSFIWYKNGQKIQHETSSTYEGYFIYGDSYSCALKGFEHHPTPSVCVRGQSCNRVIYSDRSICAFRGSSVDISCTYTIFYESITSSFWFSPDRSRQWQNPSQPEGLSKDSQYAGRVQVLKGERGRSTLRISDLRDNDSAQYHFTFKTRSFQWGRSLPGTTLTVTEPNLQVQVIRSTVFDYYTKAELKCHSSCRLLDRFSFIWYKNGQKIQDQTSSTYEKFFSPEDSYSCALEGFEHHPAPSVCVRDKSCNRVIYTDRSICAFRGSSVDISCTYSSYKYYITSSFWFSPDRSRQWQNPSQPEDLSKDFQYAGRVQLIQTETGRSTLRISDLRESDSAQYHFTFKTARFEWRSSLPGTTLTVTALQVQVVTIMNNMEAELKCLSSCSPAGRISYVWFKNGQQMMTEETSLYTGQFNPGDNISCALKGHEDYRSPSVYAPKRPSVSVSPSGEIIEGSSVTLTCSSDANPAAKYTWYKKNVNPDLQPLSKEPQFVFSSIQSSDSGEYYCTAENQPWKKTSEYIFIEVKYAPNLPSVSVSPSGEIIEGSSVTLTCSSDANLAAKYTWYKKNVNADLQPLSKEPQLVFRSIQSSDSGEYYCTAESRMEKRTSKYIFIDVKYGPKLPSVSVSPSAEIVDGGSVTLTCSSDANPAASYTWYKENDEDSLIASGQIFTITDVRPEDGGNYYCEAQNRRGRHKSPLQLIVVAGSGSGSTKEAAVGLITVIFLAIIFVSAFLYIRRKMSSNQPSEPRPDNKLNVGPDNASKPEEQEDELTYASISFSKNWNKALYSNIRPAHLRRQTEEDEEEDDSLDYTTVSFTASNTTGLRYQNALEDPSTLYSTVMKKSMPR